MDAQLWQFDWREEPSIALPVDLGFSSHKHHREAHPTYLLRDESLIELCYFKPLWLHQLDGNFAISLLRHTIRQRKCRKLNGWSWKFYRWRQLRKTVLTHRRSTRDWAQWKEKRVDLFHYCGGNGPRCLISGCDESDNESGRGTEVVGVAVSRLPIKAPVEPCQSLSMCGANISLEFLRRWIIDRLHRRSRVSFDFPVCRRSHHHNSTLNLFWVWLISAAKNIKMFGDNINRAFSTGREPDIANGEYDWLTMKEVSCLIAIQPEYKQFAKGKQYQCSMFTLPELVRVEIAREIRCLLVTSTA